jgi:hypothetical protein
MVTGVGRAKGFGIILGRKKQMRDRSTRNGRCRYGKETKIRMTVTLGWTALLIVTTYKNKNETILMIYQVYKADIHSIEHIFLEFKS